MCIQKIVNKTLYCQCWTSSKQIPRHVVKIFSLLYILYYCKSFYDPEIQLYINVFHIEKEINMCSFIYYSKNDIFGLNLAKPIYRVKPEKHFSKSIFPIFLSTEEFFNLLREIGLLLFKLRKWTKCESAFSLKQKLER